MKSGYNGELSLMAAVLAQAIDDIRAEKPEYKPMTKEEYCLKPRKRSFELTAERRRKNHQDTVMRWEATKSQALAWIDHGSDHLFSFQSVCEYLDLDPQAVKRKLGLR